MWRVWLGCQTWVEVHETCSVVTVVSTLKKGTLLVKPIPLKPPGLKEERARTKSGPEVLDLPLKTRIGFRV